MASQILYSSWLVNDTENMLCAATPDVLEEEISYILRKVEHQIEPRMAESNEAEAASGTLYLRLPSGRYALVRTGFYVSTSREQSGNLIAHALLATEDEFDSPMLYAINNCFKISLTESEQRQYLAEPILPDITFPRPQFKLSQAEIQKFFSHGRLKTLSSLIQAVIDSYENKRTVLFNARQTQLKYWFYGLHCCLPDNILKSVTYSTYNLTMLDDCELVCGAPNNRIDSTNEIDLGNFVIDILGGETCEDIESTKYAKYIVRCFYEDAVRTQELPNGIEELMLAYDLSVSNAAGIFKLMQCDFEWFDSVYDIQYFLGKVALISKKELEAICRDLWKAFLTPGFKFALQESTLPLLAFMFRSSESDIKREMIVYIDSHHKSLGIYEASSVKTYYNEIMDKIGFVYDYLPSSLIENDLCDDYLLYQANDLRALCILLYNVVDNYFSFSNKYGTDAVDKLCGLIYAVLLERDERESLLELCQRVVQLPDAFLKRVILDGAWIHVQKMVALGSFIDEELIFGMIEELITRPAFAADLLKIFAREGKYSEHTLEAYMAICRSYPDETAIIDRLLLENDAFSYFVNDMIAERFIELPDTTLDDLIFFYHEYFVKGYDRNQIFERKLTDFLEGLLPVRQIEAADVFLQLFADSPANGTVSLAHSIASYIVDQDPADIFDFYCNHDKERRAIGRHLHHFNVDYTPSFVTSFLCIALIEAKNEYDPAVIRNILERASSIKDDDLLPDYTQDSSHSAFMSSCMRYLLAAMFQFASVAETKSDAYQLFTLLINRFSERDDFSAALHAYFNSLPVDADEILSYAAFFAPFLLNDTSDDSKATLTQRARDVLLEVHFSERLSVYSEILIYAPEGEKREKLKRVLTDLYYSDQSTLRRKTAKKPDKLFK